MWHFAQAWFQEFPEYKGQSLSLSAFSYGGRYAPAIFDVFQQQNERIANGTWGVAGEQDILPLNALILQSGCVDFEDTFSSMPDYAAREYTTQHISDESQLLTSFLPQTIHMVSVGRLAHSLDSTTPSPNSTDVLTSSTSAAILASSTTHKIPVSMLP
jgi:hypothetical protein